MCFLAPENYQPRLKQLYDKLAAKVSVNLPEAEVEHIGSSAIKGAYSKGDLDVLVRVSKDKFLPSVKIIESLGFSIKKGTLRTESLCMLEGKDDVAIQLIEAGSQFENFVHFRNKMNRRPDLVEQYNQLKLNCTGLTAEEYRARKSKFIGAILVED